MSWLGDVFGGITRPFSDFSKQIGLDRLVRDLPSSRDQATKAGLTAATLGGAGYLAYPYLTGGAGAASAAASDAGTLYPSAAAAGTAPSWSTGGGALFDAGGTEIVANTSGLTGTGAITAGSGVPGSFLSGAAAPGIDLGIAATSPAFTSSPQLAATGVSGSGLPVGALPSSSAFPTTQGPMGDEFGAFTPETGADVSGISGAGAKDLGTISAKSAAEKAATSGWGKFATKYGLPLAALGTQLLGRPKIPEMGALSSRAQAMEAAGQQDIASARAGNLTPAQQAGIDKFKSDQMSAVKQYMANSDQGMDSTSFLQLKANVDQQALAMSQGFLDQLMSQGLNELGLADSAEAQLINIRLQREQETQAAFNNFMFSFGLLNGWGGTGRG